jgi:hypothetical protein
MKTQVQARADLLDLAAFVRLRGSIPMTDIFDESILPRPLADLASTFAQWVLSTIVASSHVDTVDQPIFHYTKKKGLEGILMSGSIRLCDLGQMVDRCEFLYGRDLASNALVGAFALPSGGGNAEAALVRCFCRATVSMLNEISLATGPFAFYGASFCRSEDDAFLWRDYADGGKGFALTLSPILFADPPSGTPLTAVDQVLRLAMLYDTVQPATALQSGVTEAVRTIRAAGLSAASDPKVGTTFMHLISMNLVLYVIAIAAIRLKKSCLARATASAWSRWPSSESVLARLISDMARWGVNASTAVSQGRFLGSCSMKSGDTAPSQASTSATAIRSMIASAASIEPATYTVYVIDKGFMTQNYCK